MAVWLKQAMLEHLERLENDPEYAERYAKALQEVVDKANERFKKEAKQMHCDPEWYNRYYE